MWLVPEPDITDRCVKIIHHALCSLNTHHLCKHMKDKTSALPGNEIEKRYVVEMMIPSDTLNYFSSHPKAGEPLITNHLQMGIKPDAVLMYVELAYYYYRIYIHSIASV